MKLKKCPFCGETDDLAALKLYEIYEVDYWSPHSDWVVRCQNCGAQGEPCSTKEQAEQAWNTRV